MSNQIIAEASIDVNKAPRQAENAQQTADKAFSGVGKINDPNQLGPAEKQTLRRKYQTDKLAYDMDIKVLMDAGLPTAGLQNTMNALDSFITPYFKDMGKTETVDRDRLNQVFNDFDTADKNSSNAFNSMVSNAAKGAKEAGAQASAAASDASVQASVAVSNANAAQSSAMAAANQAGFASDTSVQASQAASSAVASAMNAQSDASSAVTQASSAAADSKDAKQIAGAVSQSYKILTDGSTMTIAELQGGLAAKLTKTDLDGYSTQTWTQNQIKMTADGINGTMSSIKGTVDGQTTSINTLQADSNGFKDQFTTVNDTIGQHTTDIGTLQASSKELSSNFSSLNTDNNTNKNDISQLKQTATKVSSTLETVQTQVQDSSVGTNLLVGTSRDLKTAPDSSGSTWGGSLHNFSSDELSILASNQVTARVFIHNTTTHTVNLVIWTDKGNFGVGTGVPAGTDGYSTITAYNATSSSTCGDIDIRAYAENAAISGVQYKELKLEKGSLATDWCPNPADNATVTALTQVKQTADSAQTLATNNHDDITKLQVTAKGLQSTVSDKVSSDQLTQLSGQLTNKITTASNDASSKMVQTINSAGVGFKNPDGTTYTFSLSAGGTALLDFNKIMLNGQTNIKAGTIGTAQIADATITNAKIANFDASKVTTGILDASHINVDQLIANGINGKTITGITVNTPTLNLGLNGQFTESYNYTQDTSWFLPKKASGDVTFNHGVIEDQGTMQSYVNGTWGAINDSSVFTSGMTNNVWTEYAPGYYKIDMYKQGSTSNVLQRTYADPTGYYYTDAAGDKSYLGNVLQTPQVQTGSLFSTTLNQMPGDLRMRVVANGSDWGLQVGSYSGSEAVLSDFIYNFTSSRSSNVYITANGHLSRSTSASKYKYNIKHAIDEDSLADKLLTMHVSTWNDKHAVDSYAQTLTDNTKSEDISIKDNYGLIAEDLRDAGLDMFVEYGNNHTIEGIEYDRAWLPLLPKMRQMNDKINEYELRISKLEAKK
ncbi:hypothetical protein ACLHK8_01525 [Pediococcus sp. M21F004]|uniref:hypothetical protein n=1 Tax=Pediococcus sp. M21F004 TaxID=3390033 RepID=UPI003DA6EF95